MDFGFTQKSKILKLKIDLSSKHTKHSAKKNTQIIKFKCYEFNKNITIFLNNF